MVPICLLANCHAYLVNRSSGVSPLQLNLNIVFIYSSVSDYIKQVLENGNFKSQSQFTKFRQSTENHRENLNADQRVYHKVRTYKEYHSVCPSSELGLLPTPHPQASVPPPPCFWGEGNTRWRERGWESPNSDEGRTLWYSLYVRTLWGVCTDDLLSRKPGFLFFSDAQSRIFLIFCGSPGFIVPWFSSLAPESDLAYFVCSVWRRRGGGAWFTF